MRILCIGGGHGTSTLVTALRPVATGLDAIITTTDNGGSAGHLKRYASTIAYGDIRRCLASIAGDTSSLSALLEHRFHNLGELSGHTLGNLLLIAAEQLSGTPETAINIIAELANIQARVFPMTQANTELMAIYETRIIQGEVEIDKCEERPKQLMLSQAVQASDECIEAIHQAEVIFIGPGSLMTSIMPPLLVSNIQQALKTTSATKVLVDNIHGDPHVSNDSIHLQQAWLHKQLGFQCYDWVLTENRQWQGENVLHGDLNQPMRKGCHSTQKLQQILKHLCQALRDSAFGPAPVSGLQPAPAMAQR